MSTVTLLPVRLTFERKFDESVGPGRIITLITTSLSYRAPATDNT